MIGRLLQFIRSSDWVLTLTCLLLICIGLTALYVSGNGSTPENFVRQLIFVFLGGIAYVFFSTLDLRRFRSLAWIIYSLCVILLLAVYFFGTTLRNTTGWFQVGPVSFQPIEFVKILWVAALAGFLMRFGQRLREWKIIGLFGLLLFILFGLTLLQPDLGSALIVLATTIGLIFSSRLPVQKTLIILLCLLVILIASWFWFLQGYQKERIAVLFNPNLDPLGRGYHVTQSIIAIGSGGWFGRGLGFGSQSQLNFLPEQQTDFIFAVIAEELGFVGAGFVLLVFGILLYRCMRIALLVKDSYGSSIALGIMLIVFFHVMVNVGMNLGVFPVAGIPLPFVSYGGSALLAFFIGLGLVQNVHIDYKQGLRR